MTVEQTAALRLHDFELVLAQLPCGNLKKQLSSHVDRMFSIMVKDRLHASQSATISEKIA